MNKQERLAVSYLMEMGQIEEIIEDIAQSVKRLDIHAYWNHNEKLLDTISDLEMKYQVAVQKLTKEKETGVTL